jgi:hypothetical protein
MRASKNAYKRYFKQWNWTKNRTRQVGPTPTTQVPNRMGGRFRCPVLCAKTQLMF